MYCKNSVSLSGNALSHIPPQTGDGILLDTDQGAFRLFERAHTAVIGKTGYGKTTTLCQLLAQKGPMEKRIIFDPKNDFQCFCNPKRDMVLGQNCYWNIFEEILFDPLGRPLSIDDLYINSLEVAGSLLEQRLDPKKSKELYFAMAAHEILATCLAIWCDCGQRDPSYRRSFLNHAELLKYFSSVHPEDLLELVSGYERFESIQNYLHFEQGGSDPNGRLIPTKDTMAVMQELTLTIKRFLVGDFAKPGTFSVRRFLYDRQNRSLFLKFDLSKSITYGICNRAIVDLALKESVAPNPGLRGRVVYYLEELPLISAPPLKHLGTALNYGLGMNCRIVAAFQDISQMYVRYGKMETTEIMAGFTQRIIFRIDNETAEYFTKSLGFADQLHFHFDGSGRRVVQHEIRPVAESWVLNSLSVGDAIVKLPDASNAFRVHFKDGSRV